MTIWAGLIAILLGLWLYTWMRFWEYKESERIKRNNLLEHHRRLAKAADEER